MELLTPDIPLIIWTLLSLFFLVLMVYALVLLNKDKTTAPNLKMIWGLVIIFIPLVGTLGYLASRPKQNRKNRFKSA